VRGNQSFRSQRIYNRWHKGETVLRGEANQLAIVHGSVGGTGVEDDSKTAQGNWSVFSDAAWEKTEKKSQHDWGKIGAAR